MITATSSASAGFGGKFSARLFGAMKLTEFEDLKTIPGLLIDLRYAGENNFMKRDVYGSFKQALLHPFAHARLVKAAEHLQRTHPSFDLRFSMRYDPAGFSGSFLATWWALNSKSTSRIPIREASIIMV